MQQLREIITQYLEEQKLMQLCTVGERGDPWVCSVWQAADEDLQIYFFSAITRRHSKEIENDNRVAGALALPQAPTDSPRGLQFEGTVQRVTSKEDIATARSFYQDRIFDSAAIDAFMEHPERPHAFYRIQPKKFVLFDVVNFPDDPRQEYKI